MTKWNKKEIELLKKFYRTREKHELIRLFPTRTWVAIVDKAHSIGLNRISEQHRLSKIKINLSEIEASYLAGVIDCDGSVTIYRLKKKAKNYFYPEIKISNGDLKLINFFKDKFYSVQFTKDNRYNCYYLSIKGINTLPILKKVQKYLIAKKRQCDLVIEYCESRLKRIKRYSDYTERELKIVEKIQNINSRRDK